MIRFVDLRKADIGFRFAWWDTIRDQFLTCSGSQAWGTFYEFEEDYPGDEIERFRSLAPPWLFEFENRKESQ